MMMGWDRCRASPIHTSGNKKIVSQCVGVKGGPSFQPPELLASDGPLQQALTMAPARCSPRQLFPSQGIDTHQISNQHTVSERTAEPALSWQAKMPLGGSQQQQGTLSQPRDQVRPPQQEHTQQQQQGPRHQTPTQSPTHPPPTFAALLRSPHEGGSLAAGARHWGTRTGRPPARRLFAERCVTLSPPIFAPG
jgi:hypothetical protein